MGDPRDQRIEDHGFWMDGRPVSAGERADIGALRSAGCTCLWPLLGHRPGVGPRCRLCGTQGVVT